MNEIADAPAGVVGQAIDKVVQQREKDAETGVVAEAEKERQRRQVPETIIRKPPKLRIASVQRDGKVRIEETEDFEGWKR